VEEMESDMRWASYVSGRLGRCSRTFVTFSIPLRLLFHVRRGNAQVEVPHSFEPQVSLYFSHYVYSVVSGF